MELLPSLPRILSPTPDATDISEVEEGANWLGLPLIEPGLQIARVMQATNDKGYPLFETVGIEVPRRSTKTTAVSAGLLGRCLNRPFYQVASTAQDGTRARLKMREMLLGLQRAGFADATGAHLYFGMGSERIEFANGAVWRAVPPDPSAFRNQAFDCVFVDEAGELDPEDAEALMAGVLPTMDTRPDSQVIVAGTPGEVRAGLLWDTLQALEAGDPSTGGVVYAVTDREAFLDRETNTPDWSLLLRTHPGIAAGLTTVAKVASRIAKMGLAKWEREYLCRWPVTIAVTALDVAAWRSTALDHAPTIPERVGLGFDIDPDGSFAALVAAWRDPMNGVHLHVLAAGEGTDWLAQAVKDAQNTYHRPVCYDAIGQNLDIADKLARAPYRARVKPLKMRDLVGAAARLEKAIAARRVYHYATGSEALSEAVEGASWRPVGTDGRLFARQASASSVAALVAASEALWDYDLSNQGARQRVRAVTAA